MLEGEYDNLEGLNEYTIDGICYSGFRSKVYKAKHKNTSEPVFLKVSNRVAALRTEFQILRELSKVVSSVVRPIEFITSNNSECIILEDFGGVSLRDVLLHKGSWKNNISDFIEIAIKIMDSLRQIHDNHIIHRDLKPDNILWNSQSRVIKISDFGAATVFSFVNDALPVTTRNEHVLLVTIAYTSPEGMPGRVNHTIDYRTDYYSLGVCFFELLSGVLPFNTNNHTEMLYCHLARDPPKLAAIEPSIPSCLSDIIYKMMAKPPGDRYQSAEGILQDLQHCKTCTTLFHPFSLGRYDVSSIFKIPSKLYGREKECKALLQCLRDSMTMTSNTSVLVYGNSGTGKTTLVNQLKNTSDVYFVSGKFTVTNKNLPYSALIEAMDSLIQQVLFEEESLLNEKKRQLKAQLGSNALILASILPSIELLIGKQQFSSIERSSPTEMQNILTRYFVILLGVLSGQSCVQMTSKMIILYLDDLQWADDPSLAIVEALLCSTDVHIMFVGSCRDNEIQQNPYLVSFLRSIESKEIKSTAIKLEPLDWTAVRYLISETLRSNNIDSLAQIVFEKTKGNPFFVCRFLTVLYNKRLLYFDSLTKEWTWDLSAVDSLGFTDNVVEFLVTTLGKLPENTLKVIKIGSCFGNTFDIRQVAEIISSPVTQVENDIWQALRDGYVKSINEYLFSFVHDRIQQASYSMISEAQAKEYHYAIALYLKQCMERENKDDYLFGVVWHFDKVPDFIVDPLQRLSLAQLNLAACTKARDSLAYQSALIMANSAKLFLPEDSWKSHQELTWKIQLELALNEYLSKNYDKAGKMFEECVQRASNVFQKMQAYEHRTALFLEQMQYSAALSSGLEIVSLLGISIPMKPTREEVETEIKTVYTMLGDRKISDLLTLPLMTDKTNLAIVTMLSKCIPSSFFTDTELTLLICSKIVEISMKFGNCPFSCFAYLVFGWLEKRNHLSYEKCYEWGVLGQQLCEMFSEKKPIAERSQVWLIFGLINWLKNPIECSLYYFQMAHQYAIETGDYAYACYTCFFALSLVSVLKPFDQVLLEGKQKLEFLRASKGEDFLGMAETIMYCVKRLAGIEKTLTNAQFYKRFIEGRSSMTKAAYFVLQLRAQYFLEEHESAHEMGNFAQEHLNAIPGFLENIDFYFYRSLNLLALVPKSQKEKEKFLEEVDQNQKKLKPYADTSPANFAYKYNLVEAELARVKSLPSSQVIEKYNLAIQQASESRIATEEALAKELCGKYFFQLSNQLLGQSAVEYAKCGATTKAEIVNASIRQKVDTSAVLDKRRPSETTFLSSSELDLEAVISSSQELSSIVEVDQLCNSLLSIVVKNAGATKGVLLFEKEGQLVIESAINGAEVVESVPIVLDERCAYASASVINYCWRTNKTVVVSDATHETPYSKDSYLQENHVCSLLCIPLSFKDRINGIIYLENNFNFGAFTAERLRIIRILGAQLMISLENAFLISQLKQNSLQLQLKNDQLKEVDKMKDEFLAMTSHEFRTPLNGVIGMTTLLKETQMNLQQQDYVHHIASSAETLLVLVTDILDLARLQAKKVKLRESPFMIAECIESAIEVVEYRAIIKGLNISFVMEMGTPEIVSGDRARLKQILINMLNNAVKFTESGEITIKARKISNDNGIIVTEFTVTDSGIGISASELELLFKPFSQVNTSYSRGFTGSGLGLVICKNLCELMNGQISVSSEPGIGSSFMFSIPFSEYIDMSSTTTNTENEFGVEHNFEETVMIYESNVVTIKGQELECHMLDDKANGMAVKSYLEPLGVMVTLYDKQETFLKIFENTFAKTPFFILDIKTAEDNIPIISRNSHLKLITCFSLLQKRLSNELLSLPNILTLRLPLRRSQLFMTLHSVYNKKRKSLEYVDERIAKKTSSDSKIINSKFKILVVEDNPVNAKIVLAMLTNMGYQVASASDGFQAIEAFKKDKYDLILMDIHMPLCNGLDATKEIRKIEEDSGTHTPIIAVTASVADEFICAQAGMDDFVPKPISKANFVLKMDKWIHFKSV